MKHLSDDEIFENKCKALATLTNILNVYVPEMHKFIENNPKGFKTNAATAGNRWSKSIKLNLYKRYRDKLMQLTSTVGEDFPHHEVVLFMDGKQLMVSVRMGYRVADPVEGESCHGECYVKRVASVWEMEGVFKGKIAFEPLEVHDISTMKDFMQQREEALQAKSELETKIKFLSAKLRIGE